jgi:hypothetical protein
MPSQRGDVYFLDLNIVGPDLQIQLLFTYQQHRNV